LKREVIQKKENFHFAPAGNAGGETAVRLHQSDRERLARISPGQLSPGQRVGFVLDRRLPRVLRYGQKCKGEHGIGESRPAWFGLA